MFINSLAAYDKNAFETAGLTIIGAAGSVFLYWAVKVICRSNTTHERDRQEPAFSPTSPPNTPDNIEEVAQSSMPRDVPNARLIIEPNKFAGEGMV